MHTHYSLRLKLLSVFVILGLVPLGLLGIVAYQAVTKAIFQSISNLEASHIDRHRSEIEKFMSEQTAALFEFRLLNYRSTGIPAAADRNLLLVNLLQENAYVFEASFADMSGNIVSRQSRVQDLSLLPNQELQINVERLEGFRTAREGKNYFSDVYYTLAGPHMSVAAPVRNAQNQIVMVAFGEVSLEPFVTMIAETHLGNSGYAYIVDNHRTVVASSNRSFIGRRIGPSAWLDSILAGTSKNGLAKEDRHKGIIGSEVIGSGEATDKFGGGAIIAAWPVDDALLASSSIRRSIIYFGFGILGAVVFLGWFVGRKILQPLDMLKLGATTIGSGKFDYKINVATGDEIEELGEVFNRMGDNLQRLDDLKRVHVRAEALAESLQRERQLSKLKEEFIRTISHQLRTPISISRWSFQLLAPFQQTPEQKEFYQNLGTGLDQLQAIVQDMITVSELGFDSVNTVYTRIDIREMVEALRSAAAKQLEANKLSFEVSIPADMPGILANAETIDLVLKNLIDNAITYTPPQGAIRVSAALEDDKVHLQISDSGIGIPEAEQHFIFTQFFRASNAIAMKNVGTGLGLYIVKNVVSAHHGKVWFESVPDKGTTFHITLPLKPARPTLPATKSA